MMSPNLSLFLTYKPQSKSIVKLISCHLNLLFCLSSKHITSSMAFQLRKQIIHMCFKGLFFKNLIITTETSRKPDNKPHLSNILSNDAISSMLLVCC